MGLSQFAKLIMQVVAGYHVFGHNLSVIMCESTFLDNAGERNTNTPAKSFVLLSFGKCPNAVVSPKFPFTSSYCKSYTIPNIICNSTRIISRVNNSGGESV